MEGIFFPRQKVISKHGIRFWRSTCWVGRLWVLERWHPRGARSRAANRLLFSHTFFPHLVSSTSSASFRTHNPLHDEGEKVCLVEAKVRWRLLPKVLRSSSYAYPVLKAT
jgi:hypothetical protein